MPPSLESASHIGAIAGSVIGGASAVTLFILLTVLLRHRSRRLRNDAQSASLQDSRVGANVSTGGQIRLMTSSQEEPNYPPNSMDPSTLSRSVSLRTLVNAANDSQEAHLMTKNEFDNGEWALESTGPSVELQPPYVCISESAPWTRAVFLCVFPLRALFRPPETYIIFFKSPLSSSSVH